MPWKDFKPCLFNGSLIFIGPLHHSSQVIWPEVFLFPCLISLFADKVKPILIASFCTLKYQKEFHEFSLAVTECYSIDIATWDPGYLHQGVYISPSSSLKIGIPANLAKLFNFILRLNALKLDWDVFFWHLLNERFWVQMKGNYLLACI